MEKRKKEKGKEKNIKRMIERREKDGNKVRTQESKNETVLKEDWVIKKKKFFCRKRGHTERWIKF